MSKLFAASDLGLHCSLITLLGVSSIATDKRGIHRLFSYFSTKTYVVGTR